MGDEWRGVAARREEEEDLRRHDFISSVTAGVVAELSKRLEDRLRPMESRLNDLWDERNERRGGEAAERRFQAVLVGLGTLAGSIIGGVTAAALGAYLQYRLAGGR